MTSPHAQDLDPPKGVVLKPFCPGVSAVSESANLDFLRSCAVAAVFLFHLSITLGVRLPDYFGKFGVLLFFVHTSLVLMMSLGRIEQAGRALFLTFYIRRIFRIYPLSIVCVCVIVLFHLPRAPWWPWFNPDQSTILAIYSYVLTYFIKTWLLPCSGAFLTKCKCTLCYRSCILPVRYMV